MDYSELKQALDRFYADTNRSASETRDGLETLREEIDSLLETLDEEGA